MVDANSNLEEFSTVNVDIYKTDISFDSIYHFPNSESFLATTLNTLFKSRDGGISWSQVPNILFYQPEFHPHPYDSSKVFLTTNRTIFYFSENGEKLITLNQLGKPSSFTNSKISVHPKHPDWIIYMMQSGCEYGDSECYSYAIYSLDGGENWKEFTSYVISCAWGSVTSTPPEYDTLIICEQCPHSSGVDQDLLWRDSFEISSTIDFEHFNTIITKSWGFSIFKKYIVLYQNIENSNALSLFVSTDGSSFDSVLFRDDTNWISKINQIFETENNLVLFSERVRNSHFQNDELFSSDPTGKFFATMNDFAYSRPYVQFTPIPSLLNSLLATIQFSDGPQTYISHNSGKSWSMIPKPRTNFKGKTYGCTKCSLNLYLNQINDLNRKFSIPGVLIIPGKVGLNLDEPTQDATYISHDGGRSWKEIRNQRYHHHFCRNGNILVLAELDVLSSVVLYSLDHGHTFHESSLPSEQIIRRIFCWNEKPGFSLSSETFKNKRLREHSFILRFDLSPVLVRPCDDDDFTTWKPLDNHGSTCILGKEISYKRFIPSTKCLLSNDFKYTELIRSDCECTEDDFQCYLNYDFDRNECTTHKETEYSFDFQLFKSSGYRKIAASTCQNGLDLTQPIPRSFHELFNSLFGTSILIALIIMIITPIFYLFSKHAHTLLSSFRSFLSDVTTQTVQPEPSDEILRLIEEILEEDQS